MLVSCAYLKCNTVPLITPSNYDINCKNNYSKRPSSGSVAVGGSHVCVAVSFPSSAITVSVLLGHGELNVGSLLGGGGGVSEFKIQK